MKREPRTRSTGMTRRAFVKGTLSAGALTIIPSRVWAGPSPNEKVDLACIGIGARGGTISEWIGGKREANVVALCDVDMGDKRTSKVVGKYPGAEKFKDFRKMFDKLAGKIDAVTVSTPDHSHFPICMLAMSLGKHVYVEKPMAHTFNECELMMRAEKKYGVTTQMGNQGHSGGNYFQFKAWTEAGLFKTVRRVDAFMNNSRRWHGWGQHCKGFPKGEKRPDTLDWDTWIATAQYQDFSRKLHYGNWRCWFDFGDGAFGDWGPHILDTIHEFLELGLPAEIAALKRDGPNEFVFPQASTIQFRFPARGPLPPLDITWYDGTKNRAPRPKELAEGRKMRSCGKVIFSDDLTFMGGTHGDTLRIIPESRMKEMASQVPRITGRHSDHASNFLLACQGKEKTRSPFSMAGPLTQVFALGCIAQRLGGTLEFDRRTKRIMHNDVADRLLVGPPPRKGWEEYYKLAGPPSSFTQRGEAEKPKRPRRREAPAMSEGEIAESEAGKLFRMGRQAERFRQREAAVEFYRKLTAEYPGTPAAKKAAEKLKKWGK